MNEKSDFHNKGQEDYSNSNGQDYNSPEKGFFREIIEGYNEKEIEDIKQYRSGWDNARNQSD